MTLTPLTLTRIVTLTPISYSLKLNDPDPFNFYGFVCSLDTGRLMGVPYYSYFSFDPDSAN